MQFVNMVRKRDGSTRVEDDSRLRVLFPSILPVGKDHLGTASDERRHREGKGKRVR